MLCSKCGAENPQEAKFCSKCGTDLSVSIAHVGALSSVKAVKTWKPTTAGILSIIAGVLDLIAGIVLIAIRGIVGSIGQFPGYPWGYMSDIASLVGSIVGTIGAILIVLGLIALVGGIFALRRRVWGMALAGAICALSTTILGILAIIFVAMGRSEFE